MCVHVQGRRQQIRMLFFGWYTLVSPDTPTLEAEEEGSQD